VEEGEKMKIKISEETKKMKGGIRKMEKEERGTEEHEHKTRS
jgi:hypothetical protein